MDLLCLMKVNVHKLLIHNAERFGTIDASIHISKNVTFTLDLSLKVNIHRW